jgi:hypothetical protein
MNSVMALVLNMRSSSQLLLEIIARWESHDLRLLMSRRHVTPFKAAFALGGRN